MLRKNKATTFYTSSHKEIGFVYSALEPGLSSDLPGITERVGGTLALKEDKPQDKTTGEPRGQH